MSQSPESSRVPSLERWERMRQLFHGALGRAASDRDAYLEEACGNDAALLADINRLFKSHDEAGAFLESPAVEVLTSSQVADSKQPMSLALGARLGAYEVISLLGMGGMGEVYRACDVRLDRPVALKILRPEVIGDLERKQRFIHEAKAASALNHPNIVTIYDIGETDGTDFIVMEYVDGKTLGELIGKKGLPVEEAMRCVVQIADALGRGARGGHRPPRHQALECHDHARRTREGARFRAGQAVRGRCSPRRVADAERLRSIRRAKECSSARLPICHRNRRGVTASDPPRMSSHLARCCTK